MTKGNQILGLIAACQLVVIAFIYGFNQNSNTAQSELLAPVIASEIITIEDDKGATVTLRKDSGQWHIDNYGDALADSDKIKSLLKETSELRTALPVGVTDEAQQRFNTANEQFAFKVTFQNDNNSQTLYVGNSAGLRKTYLRLDESNDTFSLNFDRYRLSTTAASWLAKSQLAMPEVASIRNNEFELRKSDNDWQLASGDNVNSLNAKALANTIQNLKVNDVAPTAIAPAKRQHLEIATDLATYRLYYWQQDDDYFAQRDDKKAIFKIAKTTFDTFTEKAQRVALIEAPEANSETPENIATDEQEQESDKPKDGNEVSKRSETNEKEEAKAG